VAGAKDDRRDAHVVSDSLRAPIDTPFAVCHATLLDLSTVYTPQIAVDGKWPAGVRNSAAAPQ